MAERYIITVARQYGSGGRYVARMVAEMLGIPFYDKELLDRAAEESGISKDLFEHADEKASQHLWSILPASAGGFGGRVSVSDMPMNDKLFLIQANTIRKIAEEGSCVIVGRCANYVLKDDPDLVRIYINAPLEYKKNILTTYYGIGPKDAESVMQKKDKTRANYFSYYAGMKWGAPETYDLCVNTACLRTELTARIIADYAKLKTTEKETRK